MPRGRGVRCAGFTLDRVVYCTREEHANGLELDTSTSPPAFKHRRFGACPCGRSHSNEPVPTPTKPRCRSSGDTPPYLDIESRDAVYADALELLVLRPAGVQDLIRRGLPPDLIQVLGFRSIPLKGHAHAAFMDAMRRRYGDALLRRCPGFADKNGRLTFWAATRERDGYVVPYRDEYGRLTGLQLKVLGGKYLTARGTRLAHLYNVAMGSAGRQDLYVTEGATKGIVAAHLGGLWTFAVAGQALKPEHIAVIQQLEPARVVVALDREDNDRTERACARWINDLQAAELTTAVAVWEGVLAHAG